MNLASQLQTRYEWTPNFRLVFKKPVPPELKTFRVPQTTGTPGWIIFTYENDIPVCLWLNTHECKKVPCVVDERICGDTFLRVEKVGDLEFVISDVWLYNSNCIFMCSTFSQRYNWIKKLMNTFIGQGEGFAKFIHKSDCNFKIRGYEDYPEEVGKSGYFTEKDESETVTIIKLNIPDCYEILGKKAYLRVPDIVTSAYLRSKGERFSCKCVANDDEFWDVVENIPK